MTIDQGEWGPLFGPMHPDHTLVRGGYGCAECGETFREGMTGRLHVDLDVNEDEAPFWIRAQVDGRWGSWPAVPVCGACAPA